MRGLRLGLNLQRGGTAAIATPPVVFDGTNDWLSAASPSGFANTNLFSGHVTLSDITNAGSNPYLWGVEDGVSYYRFALGNATSRIKIGTSTTSTGSTSVAGLSGDVTLNWAYDGDNGTLRLYVNDTSDINVSGLTTPYTIPFAANFSFGAFNTSGSSTVGATVKQARWWTGVALDVTSGAVRAQMGDPAQAASLGTNVFDFYGPPAEWNAGDNKGTGGDFTMNGAVA